MNKTSLNSLVGKVHLPKEMVIRAVEKEIEKLKDNTRKSVSQRSVWSIGGEYALVFSQE